MAQTCFRIFLLNTDSLWLKHSFKLLTQPHTSKPRQGMAEATWLKQPASGSRQAFLSLLKEQQPLWTQGACVVPKVGNCFLDLLLSDGTDFSTNFCLKLDLHEGHAQGFVLNLGAQLAPWLKLTRIQPLKGEISLLKLSHPALASFKSSTFSFKFSELTFRESEKTN